MIFSYHNKNMVTKVYGTGWNGFRGKVIFRNDIFWLNSLNDKGTHHGAHLHKTQPKSNNLVFNGETNMRTWCTNAYKNARGYNLDSCISMQSNNRPFDTIGPLFL
jgi:hypothetical protein